MQIKTTYIGHMGNDLSVVNAARVSFRKKSEMDMSDPFGAPKLKEKDAKLIRYLADHSHISPFGHCFISVHVKAPVFIARQLVKHSYLRWSEVSRRYVSDKPEFYSPKLREAALDKKQGSGDDMEDSVLDSVVEQAGIEAAKQYTYLLSRGVCEEQARMILPQSMLTEWIWSGSLDAFSRMVKLRLTSDAQQETREVAMQVYEIIEPLFPVSWEALMVQGE